MLIISVVTDLDSVKFDAELDMRDGVLKLLLELFGFFVLLRF